MRLNFKGCYYYDDNDNVFYGYIPGVSLFDNGEDNENLTFAYSEEEVKDMVEDALPLELYRFNSLEAALLKNQERYNILKNNDDLEFFDIELSFE